ncbi:uncharacterized protein LOC118772279 [Megalops cyprinoides]|uniref:uncharacterized protein LOC118772279 n=1 Tax=Megalops cyprinoides TaxID=118141 RepID=UPI001864B398|nr:uncharacterized protein LOC118772279 [Megalops cyprinoides]
MSHSKEMVPISNDMELSVPVSDLLLAAKKTALLFHMSYLCMANFPALERELRAKATDAQLLFSSSASLLIECASTSENMVNILLPILRHAAEKYKPLIAVKYLEKAKRWIHGLVDDVDEKVQMYGTLDKDVGSTASDVVSTKIKTEEKIKHQTKEIKDLQKVVDTYKDRQKDINAEYDHMREIVKDVASRNRKFAIVAAVVPILGPLINEIQHGVHDAQDQAAVKSAKITLQQLNEKKAGLSQQEAKLEGELMTSQMSLATANIDLGSVPDPTNLNEVQMCLSRVQQILLKLRAFWEGITVMLDNLRQRTLAGSEITEDLKEFLDSLDIAGKCWKTSGDLCLSVRGTFSAQSKDTYKFLEVSPSSLSKEEWCEQYNSLQKQLQEFYGSGPAAIEAKNGSSH